MLSVIILSAIYAECHIQDIYAKCHKQAFYAECHYDECRYAGCHGAWQHALDTAASFVGDVIYDRKYFYNIGRRCFKYLV